MPFLEQIIAGLIVALIVGTTTWLWRRSYRAGIRVETARECGPVSRELGFTEPAIKISVVNKGDKEVTIKNIRLMFCREFGASVAPEAPPGASENSGQSKTRSLSLCGLSQYLLCT